MKIIAVLYDPMSEEYYLKVFNDDDEVDEHIAKEQETLITTIYPTDYQIKHLIHKLTE